jgi:hypothetical protein
MDKTPHQEAAPLEPQGKAILAAQTPHLQTLVGAVVVELD